MDNKPVHVQTSDGSGTLYHPQVGEHYHSRHGAVQESRHVFVGMGLGHFLSETQQTEASVLEVGFGTGLNFLLSAAHAEEQGIRLAYHGIEAYPLPPDTVARMGYGAYVPAPLWDDFLASYEASLKTPQLVGTAQLAIAPYPVLEFQSRQQYDVLYFDAFAAVHQPEMWTDETLAHVCAFLKPGGIFVTYAITGNLKRTMKSLGFEIEKAPGAPGKREMLRARKL